MRKMNAKQATSMKSLSSLYLSLRTLNPGGMRRLINIKGRRCLGIFLAGIFLFEPGWAQPQPSLKQQSVPKPVVSMAPLTNKDIEEMVKAGLATEIILAKIRSTPCQFDTSPPALLKLKATNVPDSVILAMVQVPAESKSTTEPNASQSVVSSAVGKTQLRRSAEADVTLHSAGRADKPRVFVTDSESWQMSGGFAGNSEGFGGGVHGGARPQTAEIIKTFGERCSKCVVTSKVEKADYVVLLEHEGGKGLARKDNKFAVFAKDGDLVASGSTRSLGNAVKDACAAVMSFWVREGGARNQK